MINFKHRKKTSNIPWTWHFSFKFKKKKTERNKGNQIKKEVSFHIKFYNRFFIGD